MRGKGSAGRPDVRWLRHRPSSGVQILHREWKEEGPFTCSVRVPSLSKSLLRLQGCGTKAAAGGGAAPAASSGPTCGGCGIGQAAGYKFCTVRLATTQFFTLMDLSRSFAVQLKLLRLQGCGAKAAGVAVAAGGKTEEPVQLATIVTVEGSSPLEALLADARVSLSATTLLTNVCVCVPWPRCAVCAASLCMLLAVSLCVAHCLSLSHTQGPCV